jgi:hypothetical protein
VLHGPLARRARVRHLEPLAQDLVEPLGRTERRERAPGARDRLQAEAQPV